MHYMAVSLTDYLIKNEIVNSETKEEYIYGFEVLFGKIVNYGTLILLAYINHNFIYTLSFMIPFFALRGRTGGYHCSRAVECYIGTIIIYLLVTWIIAPMIYQNTKLFFLIMIFSEIIIFIFSPVNHPNLQLSEDEFMQCKSASRWLSILITICVFIFWWLKIIPEILPYIVAGVGVDAGLLVIAKVLKQEVKR